MTLSEKRSLFLSLKDFDEYMDRFDDLVGLPSGPDTFRKEMQLMESDINYTHRKKDTLREARKRSAVAALQEQIASLRDMLLRDGCWLDIPADEPDVVITYRFPDGKNGDVNHAIAQQVASPAQIGEDLFQICLTADAREIIECLCFLSRSYFSRYDYTEIENDPPAIFLSKYHRVFQIERLMWKINYYHPKAYRNLRSVGDPVLRHILQERHELVAKGRDRLYEQLIAEGATNARWISEQKAYAIVREVYPDAVFQYEADWLRGQRLDVFIPSENTGIEYQGKQHSEAVDFFGGRKGLKDNRRRDEQKRLRCKQNGVRLLYWDYTQPLTREYFVENLMRNI